MGGSSDGRAIGPGICVPGVMYCLVLSLLSVSGGVSYVLCQGMEDTIPKRVFVAETIAR